MNYKAEGVKPKGRPKKTRREVAKNLWTKQLNKEDAINYSK